MNNRQELFDRAVSDYNELTGFLEHTAQEIRKSVKDYSVEIMLKQFDCILQALLLRIGFADFQLCQYETDFIKRITKHHNVLEDNLAISNDEMEEAQKFFEKKADEVLASAEKFFEPIAIVDTCVPEIDFFAFISQKLASIVGAFCMMDGKATRSETTMANDIVNQYVSDPYYRVKDAVEGVLRQRNGGKPVSAPAAKTKYDDEIGPLRCESRGQSGGQSEIGKESKKIGGFKTKKGSVKGGLNYKSDKSGYIESVVYLETDRGSSGTGFLISQDGYALTCAHVVNGCNGLQVKVTKKDGSSEMIGAKVISQDPRIDVAVIKLDTPPEGKTYAYAQLQRETDTTPIGEDIAILGYPFGRILSDEVHNLAVSLTKGHISSHQQRNGRPISFLDIAARSGNSGSPVTSLETGMVIGLLCGSITAGREEINYMSPIKLFWETFTEE